MGLTTADVAHALQFPAASFALTRKAIRLPSLALTATVRIEGVDKVTGDHFPPSTWRSSCWATTPPGSAAVQDAVIGIEVLLIDVEPTKPTTGRATVGGVLSGGSVGVLSAIYASATGAKVRFPAVAGVVTETGTLHADVLPAASLALTA